MQRDPADLLQKLASAISWHDQKAQLLSLAERKVIIEFHNTS